MRFGQKRCHEARALESHDFSPAAHARIDNGLSPGVIRGIDQVRAFGTTKHLSKAAVSAPFLSPN